MNQVQRLSDVAQIMRGGGEIVKGRFCRARRVLPSVPDRSPIDRDFTQDEQNQGGCDK